MSTQEELDAALAQLPGVRHALAYGSGVFEQPGAPKDPERMVDLLLVVDDPMAWHTENMSKNANHYAFLPRALGPQAVNGVAENVGIGFHFNAYVRMDPPGPELVKYGVVSTNTALHDLTHWSTLYLSGRLHKPVRHLVEDPGVHAANAGNLRAALTTALLLLPETFDDQQLLETIVGLSYTGDVRMGIAEDNRKVSRIAQGSAEGLARLYAEALAGPPAARANLQTLGPGRYAQDTSPGARTELVGSLPLGMLRTLAGLVHVRPISNKASEVSGPHAWQIGHAVAKHRDSADQISRAVELIVGVSSRRQSKAGVFTAFGMKGMRYLAAKVSKARRT